MRQILLDFYQFIKENQLDVPVGIVMIFSGLVISFSIAMLIVSIARHFS